MFSGKHLCWSILLKTLHRFSSATLLIRDYIQHRCFLVNIAKFLRRACFTEQLRWLTKQSKKTTTKNKKKTLGNHGYCTSVFSVNFGVIFAKCEGCTKTKRVTTKILVYIVVTKLSSRDKTCSF